MKKLFFLITFVSSFYSLLAQQTSASFDSAYAVKFQNALDSVTNAHSFRGISMALIIPVQGTFIGVSGESYPGVPVTPDMRFGVGSNTKLFTATTLVKLQEMGVLSLEDHLYDWLPSYPYIDSSATIRQLLSHQTGFFDYFNDNPALFDSCFADSDRVWAPEEILATIGPPHFSPGQKYSYSNTNYLLAGMIIQAVTGENFLNKLHEFIFDPLTMDSTFVPPAESPNGAVAHEFYGAFDIGAVPQPAFYSMASSAGAIYSTANEMATWYKNLFDGTVVSDSSIAQIINLEHSGSFYGLGITSLVYDGHLVYYHTGGTIGYLTLTFYDADTKSTLSLLTNDESMDFSSYLVPIWDLLYNGLPKKNNDAGISAITNPSGNICSANITPIVMLKNFGANTLTSVTINYQVDAGTINTYNWAGSLSSGSAVSVLLPSLNIAAGNHEMNAFTSNPNGSPEAYPFNDAKEAAFIINDANSPVTVVAEGFENYNFPPPGWYRGDDPVIGWGRSVLSPYDGKATAVMNNYNGAYWGGTKYDLILPEVNLSALANPQLSFEYAYRYRSSQKDSLRIMISTDCGTSWSSLFYTGGVDLASGSDASNFYPLASDWKFKSIDLSAYSGDALIKFEDISYGGNNLFIDDVNIGAATGLQQIAADEFAKVFPNPFHTTTTIQFNRIIQRGDLFIYNNLGKEIKHISNISAKNISIGRDGMSDGIYFFTVKEEGKIIGNGKMVVE
ncbi:MAG TPA: serine hydrolase [Chitinophagales bacterium]|nr:serine hydrolase [Chitinophagales bacterium]